MSFFFHLMSDLNKHATLLVHACVDPIEQMNKHRRPQQPLP